MAKVTIELLNGTRVDVEPGDLPDVLRRLGGSVKNPARYAGPVYPSESKGLMRISDMNSVHIKNALKKCYREWIDRIEADTPREWIEKLRDGPVDNMMIINLLSELTKRYDWKR
jgi:hypothetical protein